MFLPITQLGRPTSNGSCWRQPPIRPRWPTSCHLPMVLLLARTSDFWDCSHPPPSSSSLVAHCPLPIARLPSPVSHLSSPVATHCELSLAVPIHHFNIPGFRRSPCCDNPLPILPCSPASSCVGSFSDKVSADKYTRRRHENSQPDTSSSTSRVDPRVEASEHSVAQTVPARH